MIRDLKKNLTLIGMEDIILRRSDQLALRRDRVNCDYYRMLDGDMQAANTCHGEYMKQYSWAEITTGKLFNQNHSEIVESIHVEDKKQ